MQVFNKFLVILTFCTFAKLVKISLKYKRTEKKLEKKKKNKETGKKTNRNLLSRRGEGA